MDNTSTWLVQNILEGANNNTAGSQPLANNYLQNYVVDIFSNNFHADSNESNVLNTNTLQHALPLGAMVHDTTKNKYVDFGLLLPVAQNKSQLKFAV